MTSLTLSAVAVLASFTAAHTPPTHCSMGMVSFTAQQHEFTCVHDSAPSSVVDTGDFDGAAVASYSDDVNRTGWGTLRVRTHSNATSTQQAFAAGVLEGRLTHLRIYQYYTN